MKSITQQLEEANELLMDKTFIQKGTNFRNLVIHISLNDFKDDELIITYKTLGNDNERTPTMEYKQFLANHFI